MSQYEPWKNFRYALERTEREASDYSYQGALQPQRLGTQWWMGEQDPPSGSIKSSKLLTDLTVGPPHGFDLLEPIPPSELPKMPEWPVVAVGSNQWIVERAQKLESRLAQLRVKTFEQFEKETQQLKALQEGCLAKDPNAIRLLMTISHIRHYLPETLRLAFDTEIDFEKRIALTTIELPDFATLKVVQNKSKKFSPEWKLVAQTERKKVIEHVLFGSLVRAAYLVAKSDAGNWFETVAVNAHQSWYDSATGKRTEGIIASLQASKTELTELNLAQLDPKACFRHLKGLSTPSTEQVSQVRPIFVMDKDDKRVVQGRDVDETLESEANLAAMPWDDFEHLVRQLFEWEFGEAGVEVKVTRASRDRGVDAIVYDPNPLRGGKFVIQAKRYTRLVDVAAVRDLYGTVVNEGANRGILVTTSSYGPDSYEFAKDKPISLVDGPNLIAMLRKHGRDFRIDLLEARKLDP